MIQYFGQFLKGGPTPTSFICQLHSKTIKNFYLFVLTLSLSRQLFGNAILCHLQQQAISENFVETTCFMNGTYTDTVAWGRWYYTYYQWIPVVFLIESFMFYLPYCVWTTWIHFVPTIHEKNVEKILQAIQKHGGQNVFWKTIALEGICFCNFLLQAGFINFFLNNGIWKGVPWEILFPWNVKCDVDFYSGSDITTGKFACILPLNAIYTLAFRIMYVGFWIVLTLHGVSFLYQIILVYSRKDIHRWWLYRMMKSNTKGEAFWDLENALQN